MRIGQRLGLGFGLILTLLIGLIIFVSISLTLILNAQTKVVVHTTNKNNYSLLMQQIEHWLVITERIIKEGDLTDLDYHEILEAQIETKFKEISWDIYGEGLDNLHNEIIQRFHEIEALGEEMRMYLKLGDAAEGQINPNEIIQAFETGTPILKNALSRLNTTIAALHKQIVSSSEKVKRNCWYSSCGGVPLTVAFAVVYAFLITRGITKPLNILSNASKKFMKGEPDYNVDIPAIDEIGFLAQSFNDMANELALKTRKLSLAIEYNPCSVMITDIKGTIQYVNPKFTEISGYTSEEAIGQNTRILKSGKTSPEEYKCLWDTITHGKTWEGEFYNKKKNGAYFWEKVSISPIKCCTKPEGVTTHFVCIKEDITERKRSENERLLLQTLTRLVSTSEGFYSSIETVLREVCKTTDWAYGEAWIPSEDNSRLELCPSWYADDTNSLEKFRNASEGYTFPHGIGLPGRTWSSRKSEWIPDVTKDAHFLRISQATEAGLKGTMAIPVLSEDEVVAIMVFFAFKPLAERDERMIEVISLLASQLGTLIQRRRFEELLKESEERFRSISELTSDFLYKIHVRPDGQMELNWISNVFTTMTGYTIDDMRHHNMWDKTVHPEDFPGIVKFLQMAISGQWGEYELRFFTKQGQRLWLNVFAKPVWDAKTQRVNAIVGAAKNITDRMQNVEILKKTIAERDSSIKETERLMEFAALMREEVKEEELLRHMSHFLKTHFQPDSMAVLLFDKEKNIMSIPFISPAIPEKMFIKSKIVEDPSLCRVLRTGEKFIVGDIDKDPSCECLQNKIWGGYACLPISGGGTILGTVIMIKNEKGYWNDKERLKRLSSYIGIAASALQRVKLLEITRYAAITDTLTEVYNRRFFDDMLEKQLALAKRRNEQVSLLILDLDYFKKVNDACGHTIGDRVLQEISRILKGSIRVSDVLCRYGGEEFAIIMPSTDIKNANGKAEDIRRQIESTNFNTIVPGHLLKVTISIGVASFPEYAMDFDTLVNAADTALYKAKRNGRNRVEAPD